MRLNESPVLNFYIGIFITSTLSTTKNTDYVISLCNQRIYLISQLKYLGFDSSALSVVFHALILPRILYGIPSFAGRLTQTDKNRTNKILHKSYKQGFVCADYDIDNLVSDVDSKLLSHS
jgi:hypothetical protein